MKFIGRLADIGMAVETTRGTAEGSADVWLPKLSFSFDDRIEQVVDESSVGVIEDSPNAVIVGKYGEGEIEGNIGDKSIGLLLLSALGGVSTSGPTDTSVYTHTFSVAQDVQHDSLTIFLDDPNQDYTYALAMIDTLELDVTIGQFAKFTAGFRSKAGEAATLSPSYAAENNFLPQHGTLSYADDVAGLSSPTTVNVRSVKLSIANNVEDDRKLGSIDPVDILNRQFSVEGTVELVFDANTFKTLMLANTAKAVRIRLTNSDVTIGSTSNPQLIIDLAKVKFGEFTKNYDNNEIVVATVSFKAFYSISDTAMITAELKNTQASY